MTKVLFALAIYIFSFFSFLSLPVFANSAPDMVFQCGQDFQRELTRISNSEFMMSEGFAHSESLISSHAYFRVSNSDMRWSKNKCKIELTAHVVDSPSGRVRSSRFDELGVTSETGENRPSQGHQKKPLRIKAQKDFFRPGTF